MALIRVTDLNTPAPELSLGDEIILPSNGKVGPFHFSLGLRLARINAQMVKVASTKKTYRFRVVAVFF